MRKELLKGIQEFSDKELHNFQPEELLSMEIMRYKKLPDVIFELLEKQRPGVIREYY